MASVLVGLASFATVFGGAEAIRATQSRSRRDEHRTRKNNLTVHCLKSSESSHILEGRRVVLSGDKLYVDTGTDPNVPFGHPFAGYYLPFPDTEHSGLVSSICDDPPIMNWIYIDRHTYEIKFGTRLYAEPNYSVPFDCTRQDRRLTLGGWEGFLAVKEGDFWALYFDIEQDKLGSKLLPEGTPILEIQLLRTEMPLPQPEEEQTLVNEAAGSEQSDSGWKLRVPTAYSEGELGEALNPLGNESFS